MEDFIKIFAVSALGGITAAFLLRTWISVRITNSIKSEYDRQLELYKRELDRKQKIEVVSELLAEWIRYAPGEPMPKEYRTRLNKLSFEASLWLPTELASELGKVLQQRKDAKSTLEILLLARKLLLDDDSLTLDLTTFWSVEHEQNTSSISLSDNSPSL